MHRLINKIEIMRCNLGRSDLNFNTPVLEFFFGLVDFLHTTSGNPDHMHCNLGRSVLNCNTPVLEFLCTCGFSPHDFRKSRSQALQFRSVQPKLHKLTNTIEIM